MVLKVDNITKYFGNNKVVSNLSFEVDKGDIVGLLGPNGAGKTTTMRMITSYHFPTSGKVYVNGKDTQKQTLASQKDIGYLPENNPLYYDMLVIDYLAMSLKFAKPNLSPNTVTSRVEEISKKLDIYSKLARPINELSKGYKQRVGIASSLLHDPDLLVLDEPQEGLDVHQRIEMRKFVKELAQDKAIIISTHVLEEVKAMCNRVIVINNGELVTNTKPDDLEETKRVKVKLSGKDIKEELAKEFGEESLETSSEGDIFTVIISSEKAIEPEVSRLMAKNGWTLLEMEKLDSLEEVFHRLRK
jgi:ABC-2 type transport system ATP-binding protein